MLILGVNFGHNSSITIIKDGRLIAAIEEEKVSRLKDDFFWPKNAINRLFKENDLSYDQVQVISIQDDVPSFVGSDNLRYRFSRNKYFRFKDGANRIFSYFGLTNRKSFFNKKTFKKLIHELGFVNADIIFFDHHLSHAASAYYTAPFISDLIITCDGFGGSDSFNFYVPSQGGLKLIKRNSYETSVGQFYSMITALLGFKPNRHEGKITGLAAYGSETVLTEKFRALWRYKGNQLVRFPFNDGDKDEIEFVKKCHSKFSLKDKIDFKFVGNSILNHYILNNALILEWLKLETVGFSKEDIAYACQKVVEEIILKEITMVVEEHFGSNSLKLSLSGGVFANVRINQLIYELEFVDNIFVHPAMADSGLGMGNAILAYNQCSEVDQSENLFPIDHVYLGPDYSNDLKQYLKSADLVDMNYYQMKNAPYEIAKMLSENKIVGFWDNRLEWGPRALGARSILLNTFDKSVNDSLNKRLNRTEFMPFAPVVLDYMAKEYFPKYTTDVPAANYMTITYDTEKKYHDILQAVVHVDGTARPQVIHEETNKYYYQILHEFYKLTDCGALVNTSFNAHEEPILSDPSTAIAALRSNRVDVLIMNDYAFEIKAK